MRRATPIGVATLVLAAGCATGPTASSDRLEGTRWELLEFRSMDDAIGVVRPAGPGRYTLEFGAGGRASLRLDCNQGSTSYRFEGAGAIRFGPLASTLKLCPGADGMAERLGRDLPHIVSYVERDGTLNLALKMDGGIYRFGPLP